MIRPDAGRRGSMNPLSDIGIVLFAHGARDPQWVRPFEGIKASIEKRVRGVRVVLAFLEFMPPPLESAVAGLVAEGARMIHVVPVFMAGAGHVKRDLPLIVDALRNAHPHVSIRLAPAVGEAAPVRDAIAEWVVALANDRRT